MARSFGGVQIGLIICILGLSTVFRPRQAEAQDTTLYPIGDGTVYGCALDEWGYYPVEIYSDGDFYELNFRKTIKRLKKIAKSLRRQINIATWWGDDQATIAALNEQLAQALYLRSEITNCWNQIPPGSSGSGGGGGSTPPSNSGEACSIVGNNAELNSNIINGSVCSVGNSPVVELQLLNQAGSEIGGCTGTAVTQRTVITAAHCLVDGIYGVRVVTGSKNIKATAFYASPYFEAPGNASLEVGDLGVVIVGQDLGTRTVSMLGSNTLQAGMSGIIGGYGLDDNGNYGTLRAGYMTIAQVTSNSIVSYYNGSGSNTCSGDSGGPFFVQVGSEWVLAGVTSNGTLENCGAGDESRFANITASINKNFIAQHLQ